MSKIPDGLIDDGKSIFDEINDELAAFDQRVAELEAVNGYSIERSKAFDMFLTADEVIEVLKYAYSESASREKPLKVREALSLMIKNYDSMRRKAWAGEAVLETVEAIVYRHGELSAAGKLPAPDEWPTYPENIVEA